MTVTIAPNDKALNLLFNILLSKKSLILLIAIFFRVATRHRREIINNIPAPINIPSEESDVNSVIKAVPGLKTIFKGLISSRLPESVNNRIKKSAKIPRILVLNWIGKMISIVIKLKKWCAVAVAKARLNSSGLVIYPNETSTLVILVPTLDPIMIGIAACTLKTPPATKTTVREVVVEELCRILVAKIPTKSPIKGSKV